MQRIYFNDSSSAKVSCRFLLGGEEGRLKYAPPANFSPLFESLLPTQMLRIDPGFYMGDLNKAVLSGPLDIDDKIAFVPRPVDTSTVSSLLDWEIYIARAKEDRVLKARACIYRRFQVNENMC